MSAEELRCGMNHNVSAMLDRTDQIRGSEGIVDYQGKSVLMCDLGNCIDIGNVGIRISEGLQIDGSGVFFDRTFHFGEIVCIYKRSFNSVLRQGMCKEVVASAVNCLLCHNVPAVSGQCFNGVCDCCCSGCKSQCCGSAFQGCNSLFENILRGVGQSSVNIARIRKTETVCRMLAVMEYIRSGLINGNGSGIGCRICLFLSYM